MYSNNWEEKKISELIEEFVRGISYSSEDISNPSGIPMMNLASIDKAGYYREGEMKFYSGRYSEANKVHSGEMLIACTDLTRDANIIGTPIKVPYGDDFYLFTMDLAKLTPRSELIDADFLYYALKTSTYRRYIKPWASGTNVLHLNLKGVYDYKLKFPKDISAQKSIASLLSNIDRKIALNRQINDNLEAMAKQLYDYWFVQFDFPNEEGKPYKSSGGKMVWNEKLKLNIPEGWEAKTIGTFADVKRGSTITKAQTIEGNVKVVAAATDFSFLHNEANRSAYVITVSASGANAGFINFWREPIYASDCSTIQCGKIEETLYCYYWILHFQEMLFTQQIGAAQPHVYPEHINKIPIVVPSQQILDKVAILFEQINKQQGEVCREIESFTKQRDELLPLLMNGQVSVNYHLSAQSNARLEILVIIGSTNNYNYERGIYQRGSSSDGKTSRLPPAGNFKRNYERGIGWLRLVRNRHRFS